MTRVKTLGEVATSATKLFRTFEEGSPDLIRVGIPAVDRAIGGLFPGQGGILALSQGVGKSRTILSAALASEDKHGIVFVEDTEDVVGSRAISYKSGVNSLRLRRGDLDNRAVSRIADSIAELGKVDGVQVVCHPGADSETITGYVADMAQRGCRLVWLDYIQKVRGISDNRAVEVATAYTRFQRACFEHGMAFMVASQFSRAHDPESRPRLHWLKETGDLENEARVAILGWRNAEDRDLIHYVLEKSTMGGEGIHWTMRTDESGTLRYVTKYEEVGSGF